MIETLAALALAHVLADFTFQSNWIVANKHRPQGLALHGAILLAMNVLCLGTLAPALLWLTALHLAIDLAKIGAPRQGPLPFLLDQSAHLASLLALATLEPGLWTQSLWSPIPALPPLMLALSGLIAATQGGSYFVALLMEPWAAKAPKGLPDGGKTIGILERALIHLMVLTGQSAGIGFLIAAKSVLRFSDTKDDRKISEYVIIGTLASFLWAILIAEATRFALTQLPPLGIPGSTP